MVRIKSIQQLRAIIPSPSETAFAKLYDCLCEQALAFLTQVPFFMLATHGDWGLEISQRGGRPGFVEVVDNRTLLIPEYAGNHLALGLTNILGNPAVGAALIRPATDEVLRLSGRATLHDDADLCEAMAAGGKPAVLVIRLAVERAAFHCMRSARRAGLWNPQAWDAPTRISFGRIYAEALGQPEIEAPFDAMAKESDATLY